MSSEINEAETNLVYQDFGDSKGGSDSDRKLNSIQLPDLRGKRFLDLGCNAGFFCSYAMNQGAEYTLGVDVSERVIGLARERYPDLEFSSGGWDKFPAGNFDVVICLSAIHYAKSPVGLATNIGRGLTCDGVFVLEGGLFDANATGAFSDVRVPVWREVGDKCFHLSKEYVTRHLLVDFEWSLLGPSNNQGGDPLDRYVIHARNWKEGGNTRPVHQLCLLEYARNVAISAPTIVDEQPAATYVRELGRAGASEGELISALSSVCMDSEKLEVFAGDLVGALGTNHETVGIRWPAAVNGKERLVSSLAEKGTAAQILE